MSVSSQNGFAMILVLWILAMLALLAAAYGHTTRLETRLAIASKNGAEARAAVQAALVLVSMRFRRERMTGALEAAKKMPLNGTPWRWRFAGQEVTIRVQDAAGRVDLNQASPQLLAALLRFGGLEPGAADQMVGRISDWRDQDSLHAINGAEDEVYFAAGLESGAKDDEITDPAELTQILGMPQALATRLGSILTVFGTGSINPRYVSREVAEFIAGGDPERADVALRGVSETLASRLPSPFYGDESTSILHVTVNYPLSDRGFRSYEAVIRVFSQADEAGEYYGLLSWSEDLMTQVSSG